MEKIVNYLKDKMLNSNWNKDIQKGLKYLNKYEIDITKGTVTAIKVLEYHFRKTSISESFTCKLTAASAAIGKNILMTQKQIEVSGYEQLGIGDMFLEAMYRNQYIDIYRPISEKQKEWDDKPIGERPQSRSPYMIEATGTWIELAKLPKRYIKEELKDISKEKIREIKSLFQHNNSPVIKYWGIGDSDKFNSYIDKPFVKAINVLQRTPWIIDTEVLEVVKKNKRKFVINYIIVKDINGTEHKYYMNASNKHLAGLELFLNGEPFYPEYGNKSLEKKYYNKMRRLANKLDKKKNPKDSEVLELEKLENSYDEIARDWNSKLIILKNRSKNYAYTKTIDSATKLTEFQKFYYYLDADYRGRLYYKQSLINYQGKDIEKGLLKFYNKRIMDETGLRYLKIHTANSYNQSYSIDKLPKWLTSDYKSYLDSEGLEDISVDKMTLRDRELWVDHNEDLIKDTYFDQVIHNCEKPVTFFACCKELVGVMKAIHDQEPYYTQLPVPIDGSNNGWQHLAAMSKDKQAGELVGLVPVEIQRDFYVQTAKALKSKMKEWFKARRMPMKHIRKGISKRGSMTRAYSAGHIAIAENMYADVYQEGYHNKYNITMNDCNDLSFNLIKAIDDVCPGPLKTMAYLQRIATYILEIEKKDHIEWITPSGFPVEYKKYVDEPTRFRHTIDGIGRIQHVANFPKIIDGKRIPSKGGFASGISPNFVHSMDASHMALVIAKWDSDFAAVHDSYSAFAPEMDKLTDIVKDVFIEMYNFDNYFEEIKYRLLNFENTFDEEVEVGDLKIEDIRKSDYFFA